VREDTGHLLAIPCLELQKVLAWKVALVFMPLVIPLDLGNDLTETMALSHLIRKDEPFQGFHARPRRKPPRQSTPVVA
jgi:hypothetical protein